MYISIVLNLLSTFKLSIRGGIYMVLLILLLILSIFSIRMSVNQLRRTDEKINYKYLSAFYLLFILISVIFIYIATQNVERVWEKSLFETSFILTIIFIVFISAGIWSLTKKLIKKFSSSTSVKKQLNGLFISGLFFAVITVRILLEIKFH